MGNASPQDAAVDKQLGELGLIAKDEGRCQHAYRLTSALSAAISAVSENRGRIYRCQTATRGAAWSRDATSP